MLFDTHLHLVYLDRFSYPWLDDVPVLKRQSDFGDYTLRAGKLGVAGCLHMEADVVEPLIEAETELVEQLMAQQGSIMRGAISSCRPESEGFPTFLEFAQSRTAIKGLRRILHTSPDELSRSSTFRHNISRLSGTGLTFDICVLARQLPLAMELADACPEVRFVLDHCGVPDIAGGAFEQWATDISALAKRQNVHAKISGITAYANPDGWTQQELWPFFDHTVASFGVDRIVWGSDSPVVELGGGLENWVALTHAFTLSWSAGERDALYRKNAMRLWDLPDFEQRPGVSKRRAPT